MGHHTDARLGTGPREGSAEMISRGIRGCISVPDNGLETEKKKQERRLLVRWNGSAPGWDMTTAYLAHVIPFHGTIGCFFNISLEL